MRTREAKAVYLKAAERVAKWHGGMFNFSCNQITAAQRLGWTSDDKLRRLYRKVMWPEQISEEGHDHFLAAIEATDDPHDLRVWLLCMMAACYEDFRDLLDTEAESD